MSLSQRAASPRVDHQQIYLLLDRHFQSHNQNRAFIFTSWLPQIICNRKATNINVTEHREWNDMVQCTWSRRTRRMAKNWRRGNILKDEFGASLVYTGLQRWKNKKDGRLKVSRIEGKCSFSDLRSTTNIKTEKWEEICTKGHGREYSKCNVGSASHPNIRNLWAWPYLEIISADVMKLRMSTGDVQG